MGSCFLVVVMVVVLRWPRGVSPRKTAGPHVVRYFVYAIYHRRRVPSAAKFKR